MKKLNYELYADDDSFAGEVNNIRLSRAPADGQLVFTLFTEARDTLKAMLLALEDELEEQLAMIRNARENLDELRVRHLRLMP